MDTIIETPTTDIVTNEVVLVEDSTNNSFGKETTKTLATSIATTAVMVGGFLAVGYAVQKFQQFRTKRTSAKETVIEGEVLEVVTETPEKTEN